MKHVLLRDGSLIKLVDDYERFLQKSPNHEYYSLFININVCPDSSGPMGSYIYFVVSNEDKPVPYLSQDSRSFDDHDVIRVFKRNDEAVAHILLNS